MDCDFHPSLSFPRDKRAIAIPKAFVDAHRAGACRSESFICLTLRRLPLWLGFMEFGAKNVEPRCNRSELASQYHGGPSVSPLK